MSTQARSLAAEATSVRFDRLDAPMGLAAAPLIVSPLVLALFLPLGSAAVLATLGVLNVWLVVWPRPRRSRTVIAGLAVVTNALGYGVGSLLTSLPDPAEVVAVAAAVAVGLVAGRNPRWENLPTTGAIMMAVAVGLPSIGPEVVPYRVLAILAGGAIAFVGWVALWRWLPPLRTLDPPPPGPDLTTQIPLREELPFAVLTGVTVAAGLAIGITFGFHRDYWIMLTVLVALRMQFRATLALATERVLGTIIGASLAIGLTLYVTDLPVLLLVLAVSAGLTVATRAVSPTFNAIWVTLFVIGLLNLIYSGGPDFALLRVADTIVGGGLALAAALVMTRVVPVVAARRRPGAPMART